MWFGQTGLNVNRFETGLSASVNGLIIMDTHLWILTQVISGGFPGFCF